MGEMGSGSYFSVSEVGAKLMSTFRGTSRAMAWHICVFIQSVCFWAWSLGSSLKIGRAISVSAAGGPFLAAIGLCVGHVSIGMFAYLLEGFCACVFEVAEVLALHNGGRNE